MADHPNHTELSQASSNAWSERSFALFWTTATLGLLAMLMGLAGWSLLMR